MTPFRIQTSKSINKLVANFTKQDLEQLADYWVHVVDDGYDDQGAAWEDGFHFCLEMMGDLIDLLRKNRDKKIWCISTPFDHSGSHFYVVDDDVNSIVNRINKISKVSTESKT